MTEQEIQRLEQHLTFKLPLFYRETMLNYSFGEDAEVFMLPNDVDVLKGYNDPVLCRRIGIDALFFVGSDGGEEYYFIDASKEDSEVFVLEIENGTHRNYAPSWAAYLEQINISYKEVLADAQYMAELRKNKKWWQFWIT